VAPFEPDTDSPSAVVPAAIAAGVLVVLLTESEDEMKPAGLPLDVVAYGAPQE
jgi:hypothetical protein